jgi:hypothetical protein
MDGGSWPNVGAMLKGRGEVVPLPEEMGEVVSRAEAVVDPSSSLMDKLVELKVGKGYVSCRGEGPAGWVKERVKADYDGEEMEFKVNARFFLQIVDRIKEVRVSDRLLLFKGGNFAHSMVRFA